MHHLNSIKIIKTKQANLHARNELSKLYHATCKQSMQTISCNMQTDYVNYIMQHANKFSKLYHATCKEI